MNVNKQQYFINSLIDTANNYQCEASPVIIMKPMELKFMRSKKLQNRLASNKPPKNLKIVDSIVSCPTCKTSLYIKCEVEVEESS